MMIFTSESVGAGHPDKVADQLSDAILDAVLREDKNPRVACEVLVKKGTVVLAGEIRSRAKVDYKHIVRQTVLDIGYTSEALGFDGNSCEIIDLLSDQSPDIAQGVDGAGQEAEGAGDQGLMFGYATRSTPEFMPAPIAYCHRLMRRHGDLRRSGDLPWAGPDAKCQLSLIFENNEPVGLHTVVLSAQHDEDRDDEAYRKKIRASVIDQILRPVLPAAWLDSCPDERIFVNPTGKFSKGGPAEDAGLTGRKIIVDTYGGWSRHGGGAFSGKDPSKVDRSAAYAARHVAKNIVAAGLADRCEVQLSYAIGIAEPTSLMIDSQCTSRLSNERLVQIVSDVFDLRPAAIIKSLDLWRPIYQPTAAYGHFGREEASFSWECRDRVEDLRQAAGRSGVVQPAPPEASR